MKHRDDSAAYGLALAGAIIVLVGAFWVHVGAGLVVLGAGLIYAGQVWDADKARRDGP